MRYQRAISFLALLMFISLAWAEPAKLNANAGSTPEQQAEPDRSAEDFVFVSLCIAEPTEHSQDYLGIAGHAFLRLQCPYYGLDYCFSYESEKLKGQLFDYLSGNLKMSMFAFKTDIYIKDYQRWQRAVHEYRITMPPAAEQRLWEQLDNHMMSEQNITMDLVKFGCTNTLLKYVEEALRPDTISYGRFPEKFYNKSTTDIFVEHYENHPWTSLLIRIVAGRQLNEFHTPKRKIISPYDLLEVWSNATFNGEPLLTYVGDLVEAEPVVVPKPWFTPRLCLILLLLFIAGGVIWGIARRRKKREENTDNGK
ncbi:MAG: DUF4105 domain-containing protein [Paludibacteraceae bacterium]|nr:DUF4105 domain-containing protein [Paludibacteraceae bacterium]